MRTLSTIPARSQRLSHAPRRGPQRLPRRFARLGLGVRSREPVDTQSFGERWLTKRELAAYLRVSPRWIELQQQLGLPVFRLGVANRYRVSEVEAWLRQRYTATTHIRSM